MMWLVVILWEKKLSTYDNNDKLHDISQISLNYTFAVLLYT